MKIVLDTNTVISGLLWKGAPRQILDLARAGSLTLFTSPDLLAELAGVLEREKSLQGWHWLKQTWMNWFMVTPHLPK